ncbi:MAG: hypothetical protein M1821_004502 [Bathelium mastoideum]|nr:MAG: hypothetical protein M1821_004502 [Bathelium mastoideum]
MSSQVTIPAEMWETHRSKIHSLYVDQGLPLDSVMLAMRQEGFQASKQQYTRQLKKWGVSKNHNADEWKYISRVLGPRDRQGKRSAVFINEQEIPRKKFRRETLRYDFTWGRPRSRTPEPMNHIRVCTPPFSLANAIYADTSQSASQLGQSIPHKTIQKGLFLKTIRIDGLPTIDFMDMLDHYVQNHEDALLTQSFSLFSDFLDDVNVVFKLYDASLQLIGLSSTNIHLVYEPSIPNNDPLKRLQEVSSSISRLSTEQTLPTAVQLLKLVISLSANNYLRPAKDETCQDLVQYLQLVDPLRHFVKLIQKHNLNWIVERVVNMHTLATDMFAGNLLLHAVELGLHELTNLLLDSKCPLDATTPLRSVEPNSMWAFRFTALGLAAVYQRDLNLVRRLISAGASMDAGTCSAIYYVMKEWHKTSVTDSDMVLFQCLLDAKIATYQPAHIRHWEQRMESALDGSKMSFCKLILESLLRLVRRQAHDICLALITAAMSDQASPSFLSMLSHEQHWINDMRQDSMSQLIFRSVLAITMLKPSTEVLRLLINHGPSLSADIAADINWAILHAHKADHYAILFVCQQCHDCFEKKAKRRILSRALRSEEFDVIQALRKHGIDLHEHDSFEECPILSTIVQDHFKNDTGLLDLILEDPVPMNHSALLCLLHSLARTGDLGLLQLFVEQYESRCPSSIALLEMPEFLISVFQIKGSEILSSLVHSGIRFEALNCELIRKLHALRKPSSELGWKSFS